MWVKEALLGALFFLANPSPVTSEEIASTEPDPVPELAYLECTGQNAQGGLLICEGLPGSRVDVSGPDGENARGVKIGANGRVAIGLRRDETEYLSLSLQDEGLTMTASITPREDPYRVIEGLDCDKVDARTPEQKDHAGRSWVKKRDAFAAFHDGPGATTGFLVPSVGPMSSPFGPTRKYIGVGVDGEPCESTSVHRGYDIATPVGTEIIAPAAGTVTLGDLDLYYEGGTVFLDHGDGLVSVFMHMSAVDVTPGQRVEAGERLGATGNTGRTTGPHLHWAVKWRNTASEDRGGDFYIDPALLLELEPAE